LRELHMSHRWGYYEGTHFFSTVADQTDGTIEYTHAGYDTGTGTGTESYGERTVVLTGATWPSDVVEYKIIIDDVHYSIESRVDDTEITLPDGENPGADVSSGTSYTLYKEAYQLPRGMAEMGVLVDLDNDRVVPVVSSDQQITRKHFQYDSPDTPWVAALRNSGVYLNNMALIFTSAPDSSKNYVMTYQRRPRDLKTERYSIGTATVASGSTSVTFAGGAALTAQHVGCVLRFGDAATDPTPVPGAIDGDDNPFVDQGVILSRTATTCTIDTAVSQAYSAVKFSISDPVDIELGIMLTAYQKLCEALYADLNKRAASERQQLWTNARMALRFAMERNNQSMYSPWYAPYDPFRDVTVTDDD
jgi:hypothetical protein